MGKIDTHKLTDYIKGIAILVVLFSHYTQHYHVAFYQDRVSGVAREGAIALFFVLSGYGIYCSLEKRLSTETAKAPTIVRFYADRAMRIYPLYWLALLVTAFYFPAEYPQLHQLNLHTLEMFLGVQPLDTSGIFWFVPAIIQCYLAAPFLYVLLGKLKPLGYFALNVGVILVLTPMSIISALSSASPAYLTLPYDVLANLLLFSLGLMIAPLLSLYGARMKSGAACLASWLLVVLLFATRHFGTLLRESRAPVTFAFIFACYSACLCSLALNPGKLPISKLVCGIGRHSYSIYLFHMAFFGLLATVGVIRPESFGNDLIALLFLPVLVLLCYSLDLACGYFKTAVRERQSGEVA